MTVHRLRDSVNFQTFQLEIILTLIRSLVDVVCVNDIQENPMSMDVDALDPLR